jgi:phage-related minor tail protein
LNAFIRKTTEDLNNLQQVAVDVSQGIGNAIGSSLVNGLQSLVTGAASIKEVFANMLKSVADVLANTAAKMIAQYIAIGIARMFAGMGGGNSGGDGLNLDLVGAYMSAEGSYTGGAFKPFKEGGVVSRPTLGMVGEGGEPEYIIPESKMRESMSRYSRGVRGPAVIPESGVSGMSGEGGGTAVAAPIDVRYSVERINSVDYVTADQFQAGMRQAASQGAKQGEQQTLRRLQMSGSTRKRVGM